MRCIFALLVVVCWFAQSLAFSRCDDEIITNIKNYWIGSGVPKNILETLKQDGLLSLTHSTENYSLKNLQTSKAKCVFAEFSSDKGKFTSRSDNGEEKSVTYGEKENDGVIYEEGDDIERYIIFSKNGVTPFYICGKKTGTKHGVPAGGLAVAVNKYEDPETKSTIGLTLGLMRSLGIKLTKSYNKSCFKK